MLRSISYCFVSIGTKQKTVALKWYTVRFPDGTYSTCSTLQVEQSGEVVRQRAVGVRERGRVVVVDGLLLGARLALRVARARVRRRLLPLPVPLTGTGLQTLQQSITNRSKIKFSNYQVTKLYYKS